MGMTAQDDAEVLRCAECHDEIEGEIADAVDHYLDEHSRSRHFRDVLSEVVVKMECEKCGSTFHSDVSVGEYADGEAVITAYSHCSTCESEEPLSGVMCAEMDGSDLVAKEVL